MSVRVLCPRSRERLRAVVIITRDSTEKPMILYAPRGLCGFLWAVFVGCGMSAGCVSCVASCAFLRLPVGCGCGLWAVVRLFLRLCPCACVPGMICAACAPQTIRRRSAGCVSVPVPGMASAGCGCGWGCGGLWRNGGAGVTPLTTFSTKNLQITLKDDTLSV